MSNYYLSHLKNVLYREPSFILKYYLHKHTVGPARLPTFVFMADGKMPHGGLFDRLKGLITIYAIAKSEFQRFVINFTNPFILEKYLVPNQYDWRADDGAIVYSYPWTRPVIAYSEFKAPDRLFKKRNGQTHFYFGNDILDCINKRYGMSYEWESLYNELFQPSDYLRYYINSIKQEIGGKYQAAHFRFQNLLGDRVEIGKYTVLEENEKRELENECIKKLHDINNQLQNNERLVVFSDSMVFLGYVKKSCSDYYVVPGNVKHVDNVDQSSEDEALKLFIDMYLMIDAEKVYSIVGNKLYPSAFPEYSAKIGRKPFGRLSL